MTYPEWAKLDQYVSTLWDTRAFAGDDLKSKDDISGAKGRPKTNGRIPPLGSVSESCKAKPGIEFKYLIFGKHQHLVREFLYIFIFWSILTKTHSPALCGRRDMRCSRSRCTRRRCPGRDSRTVCQREPQPPGSWSWQQRDIDLYKLINIGSAVCYLSPDPAPTIPSLLYSLSIV